MIADERGNYASAYTLVTMARAIDRVKPKNIDNKYKSKFWEQYAALQKKYIEPKKLWVSEDDIKKIDRLVEVYYTKKYPQLSQFLYGKMLYSE